MPLLGLALAARIPLLSPGDASRTELDDATRREAQAVASVHRIFPEAALVREHTIPLSASDKASLREMCKQEWLEDSLHIFVAMASDSSLGYAVIDDVKGKDQFITYLVAVGRNLTVKDLEILSYRESYGGEVRYKSWQKQFYGKSADDNLRPGKEIKNISGATISARSVTLGVRKILSLLQVVRDRLPRGSGVPR